MEQKPVTSISATSGDSALRKVVLVFRMPKVGSSTVYRSLKHADPQLRVIATHVLSSRGVADALKYWSKKGKIPRDIRRSVRLRRLLDSGYSARWKIISLVRDPVAREISDFFHHIESRAPELLTMQLDAAVEHSIDMLHSQLANYPKEYSSFSANWFDREMIGTFGIDARSYPFKRTNGFQLIKHPNADLLVLRLEDINRVFNQVVPDFVGVNATMEIKSDNIGLEKPYAALYREVLNRLSVPKEISARICRTSWARHFYSMSEREQFIEKWASPGTRN